MALAFAVAVIAVGHNEVIDGGTPSQDSSRGQCMKRALTSGVAFEWRCVERVAGL